MKIDVIRKRYAGLLGLAGRALPSGSSESKVHFLLSDRFEKPYLASEKRRKAIIAELPAPEGTTTLTESLSEARQQAVDQLMDEDIPIRKIPDHMRLRASDLPKPLKGETGWKNAEGLAEIRSLLGSLYIREGEDIVKDVPEGFEDDEASVNAPDPMAEHVAERD